MTRLEKVLFSLGGLGLLGGGTWFFLFRDIHAIKDIPPDDVIPGYEPPMPNVQPSQGKTGYRAIDAILGKLRAAGAAAGIPLGLLVGWIARESGGYIRPKPTPYDERGYFQLMPDESKSIGVDHERLSTDSDYSIAAGIALIQKYMGLVEKLGVAPKGSSYFWKLVKLTHAMGSGQTPKIVKAAQAAGQAGTWEALTDFALGMMITGPQPKKWFPYVDDTRIPSPNGKPSVYRIGYPFGFGSEIPALVGQMFASLLGK